MTARLVLDCTFGQYHVLHESMERTRRNARTVTVDRPALAALLRDHAAVCGRLKEMGEEPVTKDE